MFLPNYLENYYYVNSYGKDVVTQNHKNTFDFNQINSGNCFKSREEAKESKFYKIYKED